MPTHARFALSNRHWVELTGGFDYIRMEKDYLLKTNDNISFSSIYLLDKHDVLAGLYNNRIRFTSAINHFPQANI
ncbi:MAG: hypothetical protein IPK08_19685 [Bacteroidetes bacterium]|nr:hypothetical protein [Bacteroidota bacterium]